MRKGTLHARAVRALGEARDVGCVGASRGGAGPLVSLGGLQEAAARAGLRASGGLAYAGGVGRLSNML